MIVFIVPLIVLASMTGLSDEGMIEYDEQMIQEAAQILAGEAPVGLMGEEAATAVAWVIRNRLVGNKGNWYGAKLAFYGSGHATALEKEIVRAVFSAKQSDDPTKGAYWVLSIQDRMKHGIDKGADLHFISPVNGHYQLSLYREDPFEKKVSP